MIMLFTASAHSSSGAVQRLKRVLMGVARHIPLKGTCRESTRLSCEGYFSLRRCVSGRKGCLRRSFRCAPDGSSYIGSKPRVRKEFLFSSCLWVHNDSREFALLPFQKNK